MLGKGNRYIQVKVTPLAYQYIKKYSDLFGVSISAFCSSAVTDKIVNNGALSPENIEKLHKESQFINATYKE